jgi:hypothetical protein
VGSFSGYQIPRRQLAGRFRTRISFKADNRVKLDLIGVRDRRMERTVRTISPSTCVGLSPSCRRLGDTPRLSCAPLSRLWDTRGQTRTTKNSRADQGQESACGSRSTRTVPEQRHTSCQCVFCSNRKRTVLLAQCDPSRSPIWQRPSSVPTKNSWREICD